MKLHVYRKKVRARDSTRASEVQFSVTRNKDERFLCQQYKCHFNANQPSKIDIVVASRRTSCSHATPQRHVIRVERLTKTYC